MKLTFSKNDNVLWSASSAGIDKCVIMRLELYQTNMKYTKGEVYYTDS
jgi:hypothetical protein